MHARGLPLRKIIGEHFLFSREASSLSFGKKSILHTHSSFHYPFNKQTAIQSFITFILKMSVELVQVLGVGQGIEGWLKQTRFLPSLCLGSGGWDS